jgi:hypothetical protein
MVPPVRIRIPVGQVVLTAVGDPLALLAGWQERHVLRVATGLEGQRGVATLGQARPVDRQGRLPDQVKRAEGVESELRRAARLLGFS